MQQPTQKKQRTFTGTVIRTNMQKTVVVQVVRQKVHPKYGKRYKVTQKYLVHDEENISKPGQVVTFVECRPLSRHKRWRLMPQAAN